MLMARFGGSGGSNEGEGEAEYTVCHCHIPRTLLRIHIRELRNTE